MHKSQLQLSPSTTSAEVAREENSRVSLDTLTFRNWPRAVGRTSPLESCPDCRGTKIPVSAQKARLKKESFFAKSA